MARNKKPKVLTGKQKKQWRRIVSTLKKELPPPLKTTIRTRAFPGSDRDYESITYFERKRAEILIGSHLNYYERVDALIHEYAHILDRGLAHEKPNAELHDDTWGVWYARCYRAWEKADDQAKEQHEQKTKK